MSTDTLVVISPTGVDVELAIAGPGSRAYAFIIDWHIRLLIAVCWFAGASYLIGTFASSGTKSSTTLIVFASAPAAVIYLLYHPLVELVMRGRTPGKWLAGVRIVKVAKPNQDMRFDVPVIGMRTLEIMAAAGASCLSVEAGRTLLFDREELLKRAAEFGIAILGSPRAH